MYQLSEHDKWASRWEHWPLLSTLSCSGCPSHFFFFIGQLQGWSIAVLRTWCLSRAFLQAVWTPKFKDWRSSSIVLSQVVLGRPTGLLQSASGLSAAAMTQWWYSSESSMSKVPKEMQLEWLDPTPTLVSSVGLGHSNFKRSLYCSCNCAVAGHSVWELAIKSAT